MGNKPTVEKWKLVEGFEDYAVSSDGHVRRVTPGRKTYPGKVLKPLRINGYHQVALVRDGKQRRFYIHRLVARAFIGRCPERHEVNHKNGKKADNRIENLEYVTRSGNVIHAYANGLKLILKGADHPSWKGGRPPKRGRPKGKEHWTAQTPERIACGDRSGKNKVTAAQVAELRSRAASGEKQCDLSTEYGLSRAQVCRIINGDRW